MHNGAYIEELTWSQVRAAVAAVNPELAETIDKINPGKNCTLFKVLYPFGATIVNQGIFHLPTHRGDAIALSDPAISSYLRNKLNYASTPVAVILNHAAEICLHPVNRMLPFVLFTPGRIFGLWEVLDHGLTYHGSRVWSITSGARFLFMLPKIADALSHKRLRRAFYGHLAVPTTLMEHWSLFATLASHPAFPNPWHCEVLFFSKDWFTHGLSKQSALQLEYFFYQQAWKQSQYWRNKMVFDVLWELYVNELAEQNIRSNAYLFDTVRQLLMIRIGAVSGFRPAVDDNVGPISDLQKIYTEIYGLKEYAPTIMQPYHFQTDMRSKPVYYSLQLPTILKPVPNAKSAPSTLVNLKEIKQLLDLFKSPSVMAKMKIVDDTPIYTAISNMYYEYFHSEHDPLGEIAQSRSMPDADLDLITTQINCSQKRFAENSPFVRGCIRISAKV